MESYPYQNLNLEDMPDEIWKEIPNFDGYYEASNLGRIKSVDRIVPHDRLYQQTVKGRMMKQNLCKNRNIKMNDDLVYLQISLSFERKMKYFNVRRLVYMTFVKQLNHADDKYCVINVNGDGYDNRLTNLSLVTHSQKAQRVFIRGRAENTLATIDRSNWGKNKAHLNRQISVGQYSLDGTLIRIYESISEAHKTTGFDSKGISHTAQGLYKKWVL